MTKQLLKGFWAVSLVAALAALSVPVQAADVACKVPFRFAVNGKTLPEGNYNITVSGGTLFVRGISGGAFVLTNGVASDEPTPARLVFHKYGDQYILRQVWIGGSSTGRELPKPSLERTLAKGAQEGKVAGLEEVVIPVL